MFSVRNAFKALNVTQAVARRYESTAVSAKSLEEPLFFRPAIYSMLRLITVGDHGPSSARVVHRPSTYKVSGSGPPTSESEKEASNQSKVSILTDEELKKSLKDATLLTRQRLQMPPMLPSRGRSDLLLDEEPRLAGLLPEGESIIFTDISINDHVTDRTRMMVARRSDGCLYSVNWAERDRLQKCYFPLPGQRLLSPLMFQPEHLKAALAKGKFCYILDRACVQFEPDDPIFITTRSAVFDHVIDHYKFDYIFGTRHLGPLALHAVLTRRHQPLLRFLVEHSPKATFGLIHLYQRITGMNWTDVARKASLGNDFAEISVELDRKLDNREQSLIRTVAMSLTDKPPKLSEEAIERITSLRDELLKIEDEMESS